jgi:hypothetical protein
VADLLTHLYVLLPVLDDEKHYWVSRDEIDKLLLRGGQWLAQHLERELIARRYLRHQGDLAREALARLLEEDQADPDLEQVRRDHEEEQIEERIGLRDQRLGAVLAAMKAAGARRVLDLGCGTAGWPRRCFERRRSRRSWGSTSRTQPWSGRPGACGSSRCRRSS